MVAHIDTIAFQGLQTSTVDVQVHIGDGLPAFQIVGLADKAVSEAKERIRSAVSSMGLSLPPKRITINLSPADMIKEGSHYDLPIALGLLGAIGVLDMEQLSEYVAMGELSLDGALVNVAGVLPGSVHANSLGKGFICPASCGGEAMWAGGDTKVLAPENLLQLINHLKGEQLLSQPKVSIPNDTMASNIDFKDVKGQESAKRALEIASAGGHNILMIGPPGSGKSMLAERLPTILPKLTPKEALDVSIIYSIAGMLSDGNLITTRPYRKPHFGASMPALIGGGAKAKPGEISLAHNGVLFLDEMPEFNRNTIEALRQPVETGDVIIARANAHITYPANFQMVGAMNPCRCADVDNIHTFCKRGEKCSDDYQGRISGPMYDRFDMFVEVPAVSIDDLNLPSPKEGSNEILARVERARDFATQRFNSAGYTDITTNSDMGSQIIDENVALDDECKKIISDASVKLNLTARSYYRVLKVARTIADLECSKDVNKNHILEALSYRRKRN